MLKHQSSQDDGRQARQIERSAVALTADLAVSGAGNAAIRIHNLSTRGFMAECPMIGLIGRYVWITLPGGQPINARVMWGVAGRIGGQFLQPIDETECRTLRAAHPPG